MKAALLLNAASADLLRQAGEMERLLSGLDQAPEIELWLFNHNSSPKEIPALPRPWTKVLLLPLGGCLVVEAQLALVEAQFRARPQDLLLLPGDDLGGELAARLAHRLGGQACPTVEACRPVPGGLEVCRPVYGCHMTACFRLDRGPLCLCPAGSPGPPAGVTALTAGVGQESGFKVPDLAWLEQERLEPGQGRSALEQAGTVLVIGKGVGSRDNLEELKPVARALGAEIGVSRPVVMNGWAPLELLIGASGRTVTPSLCLAAGVSGSAVFAYGIRNAGFIAAINTDPEAPIFGLADVGLVGDMMEILPKLAELKATQSPLKVKGHD